LRGAVTAATRGRATLGDLERGYSITLAGKVAREVRQAVKAAGRTWAACLRKVFEVDPVMCIKCGGEMKLVAVILDDRELDRILGYEGWAVEFPKAKPSRAPPGLAPEAEDSQEDPRGEQWEGRQEGAGDWPA